MSNQGKKFPAEPLADNEVKSLMTACSPRCSDRHPQPCLDRRPVAAGLRIAEALYLDPRDIEHDGTIRVRGGKGRKARTVGIDLQGLALVQVWIERKARLGIAGPLFSTLRGGPILSAYVRNLMKRIGREARIAKRVHCHGLRHSFAAGLADEHKDIRVIQTLLGHKSLQTTQVYVDHLRPMAALEAIRNRTW